MSPLRYFVVDAFTDRPFAGNPAAVVPLEGWPDDARLQQVAMEMNLSETAFLVKEGDGYRLRWFTPAVEVDLCGHATLASAHILWSEGFASDDEIRFQTKSGLLTAKRDSDWLELDFPATPPIEMLPPDGLLESLGVAAARYVGRSRFDYLVEVESEAVLRGLKPDFARLAAIETRGTIVASRGDTPTFDFVSRFFAPRAGVNEDPVTGSAHCCLGPYWLARLGKSQFAAFQASARGGVVRVRVESDRILLGGQAVTVCRGEILA